MPGWEQLVAHVRHGAEVRTHSGRVQSGDVFVALPGTRTDGASYIPHAVEKGAAWVVHSRQIRSQSTPGVCFLAHPDVSAALGRLARVRYGTDKLRPFLIGITGTNGKTTVSYMVEHLVHRAGKSCGVLGTINYRWQDVEREASLTTPGCLELHAMVAQMAEDGVDVACMEVSSHALDQERTAGLEFDLTVFTNLTQDHLDYHQDMEAYFQSKSKLFSPFSCASVLNFDNPWGRRLAEVAAAGCGFSLTGDQVPGWPCLRGRIQHMDRTGQVLEMEDPRIGTWTLRSELAGRHNASNLLAAQAVGLELGLGADHLKALEDFSGPPGRLQRIEGPRGQHVFVDYAHTPDALVNVLSALKELDFDRLFVVFGCGGDRDPGKRPLMGEAVARFADVAVLTSDNPRHEDPEQIMQAVLPGLAGCPRVVSEPDRRKAIQWALRTIGPRDALLIAGKGHECTQQIGDRKIPFRDEQVVVEYWT
ncbi:UDP-N-acetylmuramoyl-L-alanyl-D-glutamate--2,6-diaminopimelate ligase [Desulfovermiculus halophilus]|uniref:UDP-N-acetylmuramoyl-L-alanyl-D-glutamate--2, 6-diaminopimelate ligase n=1 Tax=Desulfovermiculus halophilus TaxID=339722 RepID=UPI0004869532|nr:UDP-N-acetylmuramoyl-L-alanyl-D-glutamate--2,6-diaminopimelate ligase [Desulfovermiculus halophilus]